MLLAYFERIFKMTKWSWLWLLLCVAFYGASAYHYSKIIETNIDRNPLSIFTVIFLCGLVLCLRMEKNFKSVLLCIFAFVLGIVCFSNYFGG